MFGPADCLLMTTGQHPHTARDCDRCHFGPCDRDTSPSEQVAMQASDFYRDKSVDWLVDEHHRLVMGRYAVFPPRLSEIDDLRLACVRLSLDLHELDQAYPPPPPPYPPSSRAGSAQAETARRVSDEDCTMFREIAYGWRNGDADHNLPTIVERIDDVLDDLCDECATTARLTIERDCLVEQVEELRDVLGPDTGLNCMVCGQRMFGTMYGMGNGSGNRFGHPACYWRRVAQGSAPEPPAQAGGETDADFVERMEEDHAPTIEANGGNAFRLFALARRAASPTSAVAIVEAYRHTLLSEVADRDRAVGSRNTANIKASAADEILVALRVAGEQGGVEVTDAMIEAGARRQCALTHWDRSADEATPEGTVLWQRFEHECREIIAAALAKGTRS